MREVLDGAGFHGVDIVAAKGLLAVGGPGASPSQAQQFACNAMAFGQVLLDYPEPVQQAAQADLVEIYSAHHRPDEGVMMGYTAWLVSARA